MIFDSNNQLHRAAIHEAGHVICYHVLGRIDNVEYAEIYTDEEIGNGFCDREEECLNPKDISFNTPQGYKYWIEEFYIRVAGVCAEKSIFRESDIDKRLLNDEIKPLIEREEKLLIACGICFQHDSGKKIVNELIEKALFDISRLFDEDANLRLIREVAHCLLIAKEVLINGILTKRISQKIIHEVIRKNQ